jgi:hypothetical protein
METEVTPAGQTQETLPVPVCSTCPGRVREVSEIVIVPVVARTVPEIEVSLTEIVKVSLPSVVVSASAVTLKDPALAVIVNDPDTAEKSAAAVVIWLIVQ